jgi:hypothetical protein
VSRVFAVPRTPCPASTPTPGVAYDLEPVPDLPVPGPERDGRGTMGDTVETGCDRVRDHTFEGRVPPDEHNPTR